jgi:hypothetical protein
MDERTNDEAMPMGTATDFSLDEVDLLLTAVALLESTLGHEEATELDQVQAVKQKLEALRGL